MQLLQSSVLHDSSEIILICWFAAQETFLSIINAEKFCFLKRSYYALLQSLEFVLGVN